MNKPSTKVQPNKASTKNQRSKPSTQNQSGNSVGGIINRYKPELLGAILCLVLGMLSGYGMKDSVASWYPALSKPSFTPLSWVFGPVWTVLYLMMGAAVGKLWRIRKQHPTWLRLFVLQFALNLAWSSLFFRFHRIDLALFELTLLWISLIALVMLVRAKQPTIFWLLMPYALWTSFAWLLNFSIYVMN